MKTRFIDPIIAEIRAVRDEHAARFGYDVGAIFKDIRARQKASGRKYVRYPARRTTLSDADRWSTASREAQASTPQGRKHE